MLSALGKSWSETKVDEVLISSSGGGGVGF
jgi:hypothetical protein